MKFILSVVYAFLICLFMVRAQFLYAGITALTIPFIFLIINFNRKQKIKKFEKKIEKAKQKKADNIDFRPFINVNKAPWYILELIPGVSRVRAKLISDRVKKNKIKEFAEFANMADMPVVHYSLAKAVIKFS